LSEFQNRESAASRAAFYIVAAPNTFGVLGKIPRVLSSFLVHLRRSAAASALAMIVIATATEAGAAGQICQSADTFVFGNRAVGSTTTAVATVSNCGDAPWSFADVSVHPATGPAFHVSTTCKSGSTLAPGATCTVSVDFAPTTPGQTSGALWLHNTTTTPDQLITFYGRGVDDASGTASLSFAPASADFAAQTVGTISQPLRVELRNKGPATLTLRAIVLNGPAAYDFDYGADDTCPVGGTIAAGASCHKSLVFRPQTTGIRRANLVIDSPQLASLAIMQVSGVAEVADTSVRNYQGIWGTPTETGWGISFAHQGDLIFASWFTYDGTGKPIWFSTALEEQSDGSFAGALDATHGPAFGSEPFDATRVTHTTVGTARVSFSDATHGTLSYTLGGVAQIKPLTLFVFAAPVPSCTFNGTVAAARAVNYQDMWFVAGESGWGINVTHQGDVIFASWFIYDASGNPTWVSAALNKTAPATYTGALDATTGPPFDSAVFDSTRVTHTSVGSATLTFADGANATFAYSMNGVTQTKQLTRFVFRAPGTVCE
jgi:HYDIN/CFA65/VesB family protein